MEDLDGPSQSTPPCHDQSGATLGQGLATGVSETSQVGPSENFECACHTSSENRPTPLGGWGGHWEMICACLVPQIEQGKATGQLFSSPDFATGWRSQMSGLGGLPPHFCP